MHDVLQWLPVVVLVLQAVMAWILWSLRQQFVTRKECDTRWQDIDRRVLVLPGKPEWQQIMTTMAGIERTLSNLDGRLSGVNRAVDQLIQQGLEH